MDSALLIHRLQFAFTVTYHYLFPQLTMGLAPLIVILKTLAIKNNDETYNRAARFWAKIFGINFAIGVVTAVIGPCTPFIEWTVDHLPERRMGVFGVSLILFGFTLQSLQYWAALLAP